MKKLANYSVLVHCKSEDDAKHLKDELAGLPDEEKFKLLNGSINTHEDFLVLDLSECTDFSDHLSIAIGNLLREILKSENLTFVGVYITQIQLDQDAFLGVDPLEELTLRLDQNPIEESHSGYTKVYADELLIDTIDIVEAKYPFEEIDQLESFCLKISIANRKQQELTDQLAKGLRVTLDMLFEMYRLLCDEYDQYED